MTISIISIISTALHQVLIAVDKKRVQVSHGVATFTCHQRIILVHCMVDKFILFRLLVNII